MPPKGPQESLVILINAGVTQSGATNDLLLLEKMKTIAKKAIERKIFKRPKDEFAILIMQASNDKYNSNVKHVTVYASMQVPSWDLVRKVLEIKGTNQVCNWVPALYDAVKYMQENAYSEAKKSKFKPVWKIIMMSDFNEDSTAFRTFASKHLSETLREHEIRLLALGKDPMSEESDDSLKSSLQFLKNVLANIPGKYLTMDSIVSDLLYYRTPPKRSVVRWPSVLEMGPIQIPIAAYVKVRRYAKFPSWKQHKNQKKVVSDRLYLDRHRTSYTHDQMTKGYKYGGEFHAITAEHWDSMRYKSGPKSYKIFAFVKKNEISLDLWCDASTRMVLPGSQPVAKQFYSLVQAMERRNLVAIVRKVHASNLTPRMVALFPCINVPGEPWCLIEIALPYAETYRMLIPKPMKSITKRLTDEQNEAVDNLLNGLTLNESELQQEKGPCASPGTMPNPAIQHRWHMLSHRALNPNEPLPKMDDYLKQAFELPTVKERTRGPLIKLKSVFNLVQVATKNKRKRTQESPDRGLTAVSESTSEDHIENKKILKPPIDDLKADHLQDDLEDMDFDDFV